MLCAGTLSVFFALFLFIPPIAHFHFYYNMLYHIIETIANMPTFLHGYLKVTHKKYSPKKSPLDLK